MKKKDRLRVIGVTCVLKTTPRDAKVLCSIDGDALAAKLTDILSDTFPEGIWDTELHVRRRFEPTDAALAPAAEVAECTRRSGR